MRLIDRLRTRVNVSEKIMEEENRTIWKRCKKGFTGEHWKDRSGYHTINIIWATIMTELPGLFYGIPKFKLKSTSNKMTELLRLKNEELLNKIIGTMPFAEIIQNTILAAHLNLGVIEWGCDSKFMKNPNAGEVITSLVPDPTTGEMIQQPIVDLDGQPIVEPESIAEEDSFYIKRIKAEDFLPDPSSGEVFEELSWFCIKDYMKKKDISKAYNISMKKLSHVSYVIKGFDDDEIAKRRDTYALGEEEEFKRIPVYKMYDRDAGEVYIFCDGVDTLLSREDMPEQEPYALLKFNTRPDDFYQIPEVYPMLDPQKEIEIAATMRSEHMKRNARKIWVQDQAVDNSEIDKLTSPYTMAVVKVKKGANSMGAIDFGAADPTIFQHEAVSQDQFNQIAGLASSHRGGANKRLTATAEMIQDRYQGIRQRDKAFKVRDFLIKVANGLLNCIHENLTLPLELEILHDEKPYIVQYIPTIDIYNDFDAEIDVRSIMAPAEEVERAQWLSLLDLMGRYPHVFTNPVLAKETLLRHQITSKELQDAIVKLATEMVMQQTMVQQGGKNIKGSPPAPKMRGQAQNLAQLMGSNLGR